MRNSWAYPLIMLYFVLVLVLNLAARICARRHRARTAELSRRRGW